MKQVSFKLPDEEMIFLKWFSKKTGTPMGSFYRQITLEEFKKQKIKVLSNEYKIGALGFKTMCNLGNLTLTQGMLLLEKENIEPPIPALVDDYTEEVTTRIIQSKDYSIFKEGEKPIRKSKEVIVEE